MELNKEKFEYQQELANLNVQIANANAILKDLKAVKDEFLEQTAKDTIEAQNIALKASGEVIQGIYNTKDELISYIREVNSVSTTFEEWVDEVTSTISRLSADLELVRADIDVKRAEMDKQKEENKLQLSLIQGKRDELVIFEKKLKDKQKEVNHKLSLIKVYERQ